MYARQVRMEERMMKRIVVRGVEGSKRSVRKPTYEHHKISLKGLGIGESPGVL